MFASMDLAGEPPERRQELTELATRNGTTQLELSTNDDTVKVECTLALGNDPALRQSITRVTMATAANEMMPEKFAPTVMTEMAGTGVSKRVAEVAGKFMEGMRKTHADCNGVEYEITGGAEEHADILAGLTALMEAYSATRKLELEARATENTRKT